MLINRLGRRWALIKDSRHSKTFLLIYTNQPGPNQTVRSATLQNQIVRFAPLTESDFHAYQAISLLDYAQHHVTTGRWLASEALQMAQAEFQELLPNGLATPDMYFHSIEDAHTRAKVGVIWYGVRTSGQKKDVYLYDFLIFEQFRRHGYGYQALLMLEERVKSLGLNEIQLHVFANNSAARALYEKAGYHTTDLMMSKNLDDRES